MKTIAKVLMIVFCVLCLVFGSFSLYREFSEIPPAIADATVVRCEREEHRNSDGKLTVWFRRTYEFSDEDGNVYTVRSNVATKDEPVGVKETTTIRFWPEHPEDGWRAESETSARIIIGVVSIIVGLISLVAIFILWRCVW